MKKAVKEINDGLYDANLGGNVYKKRITLDGRGKSGGARTILCFKEGENAFFMDAYAKNEKENISTLEEQIYKKFSKIYLSLDNVDIKKAIKTGDLFEIKQ